MPNCKKCNEFFKVWQVIDGVEKNLGRRKYCLSCSPYKQHNTRSLHLMSDQCIVCESPLRHPQVKFCGTLCKAKWHQTNWKTTNSAYAQYIRGYVRKIGLIKLAGGCCHRCGYDKNIAALHFHHIGPRTFSLDAVHLANGKWERILEESKKCEVLCSRCHTEEHHPDLSMEILMGKYSVDVFNLLEDIKNGVKPRTIKKNENKKENITSHRTYNIDEDQNNSRRNNWRNSGINS